MDEKRKLISEEELEKTSGGSHLSREEADAAKSGDHFIYESDLGFDLMEVEFLGKTDDSDPMTTLLLLCKVVRIIDTNYKTGLKVGSHVWLPRWNLDYIWRA